MKSKVTIDFEKCKECGYCIKFCPFGVLAKGDKLNKRGYLPVVVTQGDKCTACAICARVCPEAAIGVFKEL